MRYSCFYCGKPATSELPDDAVIRAVLECPECVEKESAAVQAFFDGIRKNGTKTRTTTLREIQEFLEGRKTILSEGTR